MRVKCTAVLSALLGSQRTWWWLANKWLCTTAFWARCKWYTEGHGQTITAKTRHDDRLALQVKFNNKCRGCMTSVQIVFLLLNDIKWLKKTSKCITLKPVFRTNTHSQTLKFLTICKINVFIYFYFIFFLAAWCIIHESFQTDKS